MTAMTGVEVLTKYFELAASCGSTAHEFMAEHGRVFEHDSETYQRFVPGKPKDCYANAGRMALLGDDSLVYVEGYILFLGLPIQHAWLWEPETGRIYDPTLTDGEDVTLYFGVPFKREYLRETVLRTKVWGIFHNANRASVASLIGGIHGAS